MSNAFLSSGGSLSALTQGTFNLDVASVVDRGLTPGLPVAVSSNQTLVTRLITPSDLSFTPLTNPATADLSLAGYKLTNVASITQPAADSNVKIGNTLTNTGTANSNHVQIGAESSIASGAFIGCVAAGYRATCSDNGAVAVGNTSTANAYAVAVGQNASASLTQNVAVGQNAAASGITSIAIGPDSIASGFRAIAVGKSATASASAAIMIGPVGTNSVANTCKIGGSSITAIYPSSAVCDLGTTSVPFKNVYVSGAVDSTATLSLGTTNATAVSIGKTAVNTTINGLFITPLPRASWYCTANTLPSFVANVWRAVAIAPSSSSLVDFTINGTTGALTYTGALTRTFEFSVNMNMSFTAASTFFAAINKNPTTPPAGLISTQSSVIWDVTVATGSRQQLVWTDQISLAQNDIIQICARWNNTSATQVTIGRTSFLLKALPN